MPQKYEFNQETSFCSYRPEYENQGVSLVVILIIGSHPKLAGHIPQPTRYATEI
jgi:hypothetical protein